MKRMGENSKILRCGLVIIDRILLEILHREQLISGDGIEYIILYFFWRKIGVNTEILIGGWEKARSGCEI